MIAWPANRKPSAAPFPTGDASTMRFFERLGELVGHLDDLPQRNQPAASECLERLALDVLHDDERAAVGVADLVDFADEGMIERGGGERLPPQTLARDLVVLAVGSEELDRDTPLETRVVCEKHLAHAAGAEGREETVAVCQEFHGSPKEEGKRKK